MEFPDYSCFCLSDYTFGCPHSATSLRCNNLLGQLRAQGSFCAGDCSLITKTGARGLANKIDAVLVTTLLLWPNPWQETTSGRRGSLWLMIWRGIQSIREGRRGSWGLLAHVPDEEAEKREQQSSNGLLLFILCSTQVSRWGYTHIQNKCSPLLTLW